MTSPESELKVYLAARFSRKIEIKEKSLELKSIEIDVTSRWLDEESKPDATLKEVSDELNETVADYDIEDIDKADVFVLFSENPEEAFPRGGRHFETGYAYGKGKPIIILGPKENIFHYMKKIILVDTWEELKANLKFLKRIKAA